MVQKIINVGSTSNDGTGDTIRGAFTNVNSNFTEVYANVATAVSAHATANAAFGEVNTVNSILQTVATSANLYSNVVGAASNAYSNIIGSSSNTWANTVGTAGNNYTNAVGTAGNNYAIVMDTAGNNYASILAANNAVGANAWANAVGAAANNRATSTFTTLTNTAIIFNTTNAAFGRANTSFQNTSGTLSGDFVVSGNVKSLVGFDDGFGPIRERFTVTISANTTANSPHLTYIANNLNTITIRIPDDKIFSAPANVGTSIEIYQYGTGNTKIIANDAAVTVRSANNWANIAGQYLTASVVKVLANTWILTGDLKP